MLSNGENLGGIVQGILAKQNLSLAQQADLDSSTGGSFEPEDLELAMIDVQILGLEENTTELIKLYKRLPQPRPINNDLADYLGLPHSAELSRLIIGEGILTKEFCMSNLFNIVDKTHKKIRFTPNKAQIALIEALKEHPRVVCLKSRQRGISTYAVLNSLFECLTHPNKARGIQALDLKSSNSLMKKAKLAYMDLPSTIKPKLLYDNNSELAFDNGSSLLISTSFRGTTLNALHVSELGKIALSEEKASELKSGTLQALPSNAETEVVFESTAEGPNNYFAELYEAGVKGYTQGNYKTAKAIFLGWIGVVVDGVLTPNTEDVDCILPANDDTVVPKELNDYLISIQKKLSYTFSEEQVEWAVSTYKELGSDLIEFKREYPAVAEDAFSSSGTGLILYDAYNRLSNHNDTLERNPKYPLYAVSDLGISDTFFTIFFQYYSNRVWIVAEHFGTGQPLSYYVKEVIRMDVAQWYIPHDARQKELQSAKKRTVAIKDMGFTKFTVLKRAQNLWDSVSRTRTMMGMITFGDVPELIDSVKSYRKKWSVQLGQFEDTPLHNYASHGCDSLRYCIDAVLDRILK